MPCTSACPTMPCPSAVTPNATLDAIPALPYVPTRPALPYLSTDPALPYLPTRPLSLLALIRLPEEQKYWDLCYQGGLNSSECAQKGEDWKHYAVNGTANGTVCVARKGAMECTATFLRCDDMPADSCSAAGSTDPELNFISSLLMCKSDPHSQCKSQEECQAAGECHGGHWR